MEDWERLGSQGRQEGWMVPRHVDKPYGTQDRKEKKTNEE
jgi:hypothetical protein